MISKGFAWSFWIIIGTVCTICNALIIHAVIANQHMRTTTNYLIVNMAVGDALATLMTTWAALYMLEKKYEFEGDVTIVKVLLCKGGYCSFYAFMLCSVFSLVGITFDRFLAVTRPLKHSHHSSWTKFAIPVIWLASVVIPANYGINKVNLCLVEPNKYFCQAYTSKFDAVLIMAAGFVLPHIVTVILYVVIAYKLCTRRVPGEHAQNAQGNTAAQQVARKVTCMIVCILVAFEVSWCPFFFGHITPFMYSGTQNTNTYLRVLAYKALMASNGISNFLIYAIFNQNFRSAFKKTLRCGFPKCLRKLQVNGTSVTASEDHILSQPDQTSTATIPTGTTDQKT